MKKIIVTDITLKKLAAERNTALLFREKTAIAAAAAALGADVIELPAVKSPREDQIISKTIAKSIGATTLAIPVGFDSQSVAAAYDCIKDAEHPRLIVELPVSTVVMEYTYHMKSDKMLGKIRELVEACRALCPEVELCALDATRADAAFVIEAAAAAEASGATHITVCDDAGICMPEQIAELISTVKQATSLPVYVSLSDRISMAVACAISAIGAGADGVKCAMAGTDALLTGRLSDAMAVCSAAIGAEVSLNETRIHAGIEELLSSINHREYTDSASVSEKKKILLNSESSISDVSAAAEVLGYDLTEADCGNVHRAVMSVCERRDTVGAKELEAIIASSAMQAPSTYHLESYTTSSSNVTGAMSQVTLSSHGETLHGVSIGDGPIDSAFRAIEQCIGYHYELDDFQVQSVTEGKEALGSAVVRLRNNGKLYSGNGTSADIVAASIRAYINALNKIVFEEE